MNWISITEKLPENEQMVLAYLPNNHVPVPGNPGSTTFQPIKLLIFNENFYGPHRPKHPRSKSNHFWSGNGLCNHFFQEVTHWMPLPTQP